MVASIQAATSAKVVRGVLRGQYGVCAVPGMALGLMSIIWDLLLLTVVLARVQFFVSGLCAWSFCGCIRLIVCAFISIDGHSPIDLHQQQHPPVDLHRLISIICHTNNSNATVHFLLTLSFDH